MKTNKRNLLRILGLTTGFLVVAYQFVAIQAQACASGFGEQPLPQAFKK